MMADSGNSTIAPSDSKSDKGHRVHHQHNGRIVKLNQSASKEQTNNQGKFLKGQSPNSKQKIPQRHLGEAATDLLANSVKVNNATSQFAMNHGNGQSGFNPVYQTIVKIGENHVLNGNMSKIKNQFVQKSGHLMASNYIKELDRQTNNISNAYQSDSFQNGGPSKHREMSNYSNNSNYTQIHNKVGGQLKQNSSGGIKMQQPLAQQNPNSAGIPIFIQRNQPWHSVNTQNFNMQGSSSGIAGMPGQMIVDQQYQNQGNGQSIVLPQITPQKDLLAAQASQQSSVIDSQRPTPVQTNGKKMNVSDHQHDFAEYYNHQLDNGTNVPMISDGAKGTVSASTSFKKSAETNSNYQQEQPHHNHLGNFQNDNRNNSGRANMANKGSSQMTANHTWQTASTTRKQKSTKVVNALESAQSSNFSHHNKQSMLAQFVNPKDQSGAYEMGSIPMNNSKTANGIYQLAMKSAASTVGSGVRTNQNSLQLADKEQTIKMHQTGDVGKQVNNTMQSNRDELSVSSNLQRSMNFRRHPSKEMRSNSAKWNNKSFAGKNYGTSISHKSPPSQHKLVAGKSPTQFNDSDIASSSIGAKLRSPNQKHPTANLDFSSSAHRQVMVKQADRMQIPDFKLKIQGQQQKNLDMHADQVSPGFDHLRTGQTNDMSPRHPKGPPLHVGFQFSYDPGDEPDEDDDEMNNTDGDEEGEEEQEDILIVEGDEDDLDGKDSCSSPGVRGKSASEYRSAINYGGSAGNDKKANGMGLALANKSLNASQEEMNTQLYSGDIYLLGGSHFLMKDTEKKEGENAMTTNKQSQDSTTTGSEVPYKNGQLNRQVSQLKKRGTGRSRKRGNTKGSKHLQKIQERNSAQEAEEEETSIKQAEDNGFQNEASQKELAHMQSQLAIPNQALTDKQRKNAIRDEFLRRPPNGIITMIKSPFASRDPFIFFPYPPFLNIQRDLPRDYSRIVQYTQDQLKPYCTPGFKVSESTHTYNCVVNALKMAGFRHVTGAGWNVIWTGLFRQGRLRNMSNQQHINHFAGSWAIGRKDYMWRNVQRMRRLHGKAFDIAPPTYIFPEDYKRWMSDRETSNFKNMYILKPNAASCGKGIRVIGKKQNVNKRAGYIVSKYVSKPHLIQGYKYDLRLYVLVTSFDPIKIYLFKDGLVRLATVPYSTSKSSLKQRFVHLTNYSVNKKADAYVKNTNSPSKTQNAKDGGEEGDGAENEEMESKLSLAQLRKEFQKMNIDYNEVFAKIKDLIIKTVFSAEQPILQCMGGNKNKNACFEIYGFDVIIDAKLRPWLLEVNVSPSLSSSSPLDKQIKSSLLSDTLYLIGFRLIDRKQQELEKAKQNKQRLFGFDSQKKKQQSSEAMCSGETSKPEDSQIVALTNKEPVKSGGGRSRQPIGSNGGAQGGGVQGSAFNSFISNDSNNNLKDIQSAGLPSQQLGSGGLGSAGKSGSPNRRRANYTKMQPPRPWLKDQGEPSLGKSGGANANSSLLINQTALDGYVNLTENDLDILADFEEEQQRKGHFELLFPTAKNVDNYRPFLSSNRRANLLLWVYLKQGAPMHHLVNHFKYLHMQSQLLQQQAAGTSASTSM